MNKKNPSVRHLLDGAWDLSFTMPEEETVVRAKAPVPGNVEPVLVELGLLDDYMPATHYHAAAKFELVDDWTYTTTFDAPTLSSGWKRELVFEGIDTMGEIWLNGEKLADCHSMHLTYRFDVADLLKPQGNELTVIIRSTELWARNHPHPAFVHLHGAPSFYSTRAYVRKARHQWGWDNAPRLFTTGIIRSVYLEDLPPVRFNEVYLYTEQLNEDSVIIGTCFDYKTDKKYIVDQQIRLTLLDGEREIHTETHAIFSTQGRIRVTLPRDAVKLWWPTGFGNPDMHTIRLEILLNGEIQATYEQDFGIRTLKLERTEDILEDGSGEFVFRVNGEKVFIRGTNWKPLHPLASVAHAKTAEGKALEEIKNLNCNMVRIWGGGIYEDHCFFDYCDKNGIMVWQDFMLACEIPVADDAYCKLVAQEAVQQVKKLRNHPSLAVWCGDNENDEMMVLNSAYSEILPSDMVITRKYLRDAALHHDPYRSFVESSPYASDTNCKQRFSHSGKVDHFQPEVHLYPDSMFFSEALRNGKWKFTGETGPIAMNAATVNPHMFEREKERAERLWDSGKLYSTHEHQDDGYFVDWRLKCKQVCEKRYGRDFSFAEFKDYALAVNIACGEIFKECLEYCRTMRWTKTGVLWWSLMDMWPMLFNYSVIDSDGMRKLPYYWIRQSQQEIALMAVRKELDGELALYAANDTLSVANVEYTVTAYDMQGNGKPIASGICDLKENSATLIQRIAEGEEPALWIIRWKVAGKECTNHVFTKYAPFETVKLWTKIIGEQCGFGNELEELK